MNFSKYISVVLTALCLSACSQEAPDARLTVTTDKSEIKAGEPVSFRISGKADNIVFYSGETGHEYDLRDREYADNDLMVDFVSYTDYLTYVHPNLRILISSDFNGIYDAENLALATWTDVTDEFQLPAATGKNTPSGTVNLKKFVSDDNDALFYIAFRYFDLDGVGLRNRWVIRSININKVSPEGQSTLLADIKTAGWQNVVVSGAVKWTLSGTQLLATGNATSNDKDVWAVSRGYNLRSSEPSTGVVLKNISTVVSEYQHTYNTPGTYEAVFASSSVWYNSDSHSTTRVKVTVTE